MPREMGHRGNINLPSDEELTFKDEPDLPYLVMKASAVYLGKYCETQNNEFMLCRAETNDPRKCLKDGNAVTACSLEFYKKLKKHCMEEFTTYSECLRRSRTFQSYKCGKSEKILDQCVLQNLNIERPPMGYFTQARIHDSPRPKPEPFEPEEYPDRVPPLPPRDGDYPNTRFGYRGFI